MHGECDLEHSWRGIPLVNIENCVIFFLISYDVCAVEFMYPLRRLADKRNEQGAGCCFDGSFAGKLQAQLQANATTEWPHRAALRQNTEKPQGAVAY